MPSLKSIPKEGALNAKIPKENELLFAFYK